LTTAKFLICLLAGVPAIRQALLFKSNIIQNYNLKNDRKKSLFCFGKCSGYSFKSPPQKHTVHMGLLDGLKKKTDKSEVNGRTNSFDEKVIDAYQKRANRINSLEEQIESLTDAQLQAKTADLKKRIRSGASLDSVLDEAFAIVREAAWRVLELRHYDVQLIGGMVLSEGKLAEMATGEGKTLVATLPTFLYALTGRGAYVVTANDYLAKRDSDTMGQVHRFLGLSVGLIQNTDKPAARREAYSCDVTYLTNAELGFDYLRDNLAMTTDEVVQVRPFHFCLVDEADSILIDEARTPLIISKQVDAPKVKFQTSAKLAELLERDYHYTVIEKSQNVQLTEAGMTDCEKIVKQPIFNAADPWAPYIQNAIKAKELFKKGKEYLVRADEVVIVDQFSGRILEGRRYSDGLHQSIEAKEGLVVSKQSEVIATVTYQSLFKNFPTLAGMSGTLQTEEKEFEDIYGLSVVVVPTALPVIRKDYNDAIYRTKSAKLKALLQEVERVHGLGAPVLIGTTSVENSELIADKLKEMEIECEVLNAKPENIDRESEIVAQAGRAGKVTVATNMAGRGTDILIGGNPAVMAKILLKGALSEVLLQPEELSQKRKVSADFFPKEISDQAKKTLDAAVSEARRTLKERIQTEDSLDELIAVASETGPTGDAAFLAVREAFVQIKEEYAEELKADKGKILKLGGLYVIGTDRHESRRIDNQLRGRAGRQGDPGGSRFFLSLEDEIFRLFGGDKISSLMNIFRLGEDIPLEAKQVTETIDKVQKQVEEYYSGIRRTVFQYDEVLNTQRQAVYSKRGSVLAASSEELQQMLRAFCKETVDEIVPAFVKEKGVVDAKGLSAKIKQFFNTVQVLEEQRMAGMNLDALYQYLYSAVDNALDIKNAQLETRRPGMTASVVKYLTLVNYDNLWQAHLQKMDLLKSSSSLSRFAGEDPLDVYKLEGFQLFKSLFNNVKLNTVYSFFIYNPVPDQTK